MPISRCCISAFGCHIESTAALSEIYLACFSGNTKKICLRYLFSLLSYSMAFPTCAMSSIT